MHRTYNYYQYRNFGLNNQYYRSPFSNGTQFRNIPLSIPKGSFFRNASPLLGQGLTKGTFSRFISGTENIISTINQMIPLYQQIKPMFSSSSVLKGAFSKMFKRQTQTKTTREIYEDVEVVNPKKSTKNTIDEEQFSPNKPFFG